MAYRILYLTTESSPSHIRLPGSPVLVRPEHGSVGPRERSNNLTRHCARFNCGDRGTKILHKLMQKNPTTAKFLLNMMTKKPAFYLMISVAMSDHDVVLLLGSAGRVALCLRTCGLAGPLYGLANQEVHHPDVNIHLELRVRRRQWTARSALGKGGIPFATTLRSCCYCC